MNHVYRTVFNASLGLFQVASEHSRSHRKAGSRCGTAKTALAAASLLLAPLSFASLPTGGNIVHGSGSIATPTAQQLLVNQTSHKLITDWQSFNIAEGHKVTFNQPSASSVALNRVVGSDASSILGSLNANGQVFLVNPNGVLFGQHAQVNVGGLVASTLDISNADFIDGNYRFSGDGSAAAVLNQGRITAADGGAVALLGGRVSNEGIIQARLGSVALAAGQAITLDFAGDGLLSVQIDQPTLDALVENHQLIQADGGQVLLTASAADALLQTVVNNTGVIRARSLQERDGQIVLLGDFAGGTVQVAGTLDASAPDGGDGGFIDTSGHRVRIDDSVQITTKAANGQNGTWLIDPDGFTIGQGGDISGATLSSQLASNNVTLASVAGSGGDGHIHVNDRVSWSQNTLTLTATNNIYVNNEMNATGSASFVANYGSGTDADGVPNGLFMAHGTTGSFAGKLNFDSTGSVMLGGKDYQVINTLEDLQGMVNGTAAIGANPSVINGYALGNDLDLSSIEDWQTLTLSYIDFNGLGHTVDRLHSTSGGLFGLVTAGSINNVGITNADVRVTDSSVGLLASQAYHLAAGTTLANVFTTGRVESTVTNTSSDNYVGGVMGYLTGTAYNTYSTAEVFGGASQNRGYVGGLFGVSMLRVSDSYFAGSVTYADTVAAGGLIGRNAGHVTRSYSTGDVTNLDENTLVSTSGGVGGLIGHSGPHGGVGLSSDRMIESSYATGNVTYSAGKSAASVGGFIGNLTNRFVIDNAYATGNVVGRTNSGTGGYVGGFAGQSAGTISNAYATGNVTGGAYAGGFIGSATAAISNAYATGDVTAEIGVADAATGTGVNGTIYAGGFAGRSTQSITNAYSTGNVTVATSAALGSTRSRQIHAGGFIGYSTDNISNAYSTGNIAVSADLSGVPRTLQINTGGFAGNFFNGSLNQVYASGDVGVVANVPDSASDNANSWIRVGGLVGNFQNASATTSTAYATGNVSLTGAHEAMSTAGKVGQGSLQGGGAGALDTSVTTTAWSVLPDASVWQTGAGGANPQLSVFANGPAWGASANGSPILISAPLRINVANSTYGDSLSLDDFVIHGLQGGDTASSVLTYDPSGYLSAYGRLNAGAYQADDLLGSSTYQNIKGLVLVQPRVVSITGAVAEDKTYDGQTNAVISNGGSIASGILAGEVLNIDTALASFEDRNAGENKTVHLNYLFRDGNGDLTSNYVVDGTITADITPKTLSVGFTADDKIYDGTAAATVSATSLDGLVAGDAVNASYTSATFSDRNAGDDKSVMLAGIGLSGADAGNYLLASTSAQANASITPLVLVLSGVKSADGTATINAGDLFINNAVAGDNLLLSGHATLTGSTAGTQTLADVSTLQLDNGNYTLAGSSGLVTVGDTNLAISQVAHGTADISTSGSDTTITVSDRAVLDWLRFSIGADETVNFVQPDASSVVLNRVVGSAQTLIEGTLSANGKVFIINANGVLFSAGSSVNASGLVASSLNLSNSDFINDHYFFQTTGGRGSVINAGDLVIVDGGYLALLSAGEVSNTGQAEAAEMLLASAEAVTLVPGDSALIANPSGSVEVAGQLTAPFIELAGESIALSGTLDTGVNGTLSLIQETLTLGETGSHDASFVQEQLAQRNLSLRALSGDIAVDAPLAYAAHTLTLDAAENIRINDVVDVSGSGGFTAIHGSGTNADGTAHGLYTKMGANDDGNFVGKVDFSGSGALRMGSRGNVETYTVIREAWELSMYSVGGFENHGNRYALGNDIDMSTLPGNWTPVDLTATLNGLGHVVDNLTSTRGGLFNELKVANLRPDWANPMAGGGYESIWDGRASVTNLGVTNVAITASPTAGHSNYIGALAGYSNGVVANTFATGSISVTIDTTQELMVGGLIGSQNGWSSIFNSYTNMDITVAGGAGFQRVGGFIGANLGLIQNSHAKGTITAYGGSFIGGFAGQNTYNGNQRIGARIFDSYADVDIHLYGGSIVGGFVGSNQGKSEIANSYAQGNISGETDPNLAAVGGFAGMNTEFSSIDSSYATGDIDVTGLGGEPAGNYVGGFVGWQGDRVAGVDGSTITNSHATGNVSSTGDYVGGFAGRNDYGALIDGSYSTGNVRGRNYVGGFIGINGSQILDVLLMTGNTPGGYFSTVEEHIAFHNGNYNLSLEEATVAVNRGPAVSNSYASGTVEATGENAVSGAFAGENAFGGQINASEVRGDGAAQANESGTGFVGANGRGDDYISQYLGADRGTSSIIDSGVVTGGGGPGQGGDITGGGSDDAPVQPAPAGPGSNPDGRMLASVTSAAQATRQLQPLSASVPRSFEGNTTQALGLLNARISGDGRVADTADPASFSANVQRIEVDGVIYELEAGDDCDGPECRD